MTSLRWALALALFPLLSCQHTGLRNPSAIEATAAPAPILVCSFNIQFLGSFKARNNKALANILAREGCDLVAVQELVSPPDLTVLPASEHFKNTGPVLYPGSSPMKPSAPATEFFIQMHNNGFDGFVLSPEDTGGSPKNHTNSSATEWWVVFFKTSKAQVADDLPNGFLSNKVTANPNWDRVPYSFAFRTLDKNFDFVLISTHLRPGKGTANQYRRAHELEYIQRWIEASEEQNTERDYIILGDMNIYSELELEKVTPQGFVSLNTKAQFTTNTNLRGQLPYDHVMVRPEFSSEAPVENNFLVFDLLKLAREFWTAESKYPGDTENYKHDAFRIHFSDHHPIGFYLYPTLEDDD